MSEQLCSNNRLHSPPCNHTEPLCVYAPSRRLSLWTQWQQQSREALSHETRDRLLSELLPVGCWWPPASWLVPDPGSSRSGRRRWSRWPAPSYAPCGKTSRCQGVKESKQWRKSMPGLFALGLRIEALWGSLKLNITYFTSGRKHINSAHSTSRAAA